MAILIDGYNLLHVTGVFSDAVGPGAVEKLHAKLLDFLAALLNPSDVCQTTVVFDAKGRRAASRRSGKYAGITVHYAARTEEADDLLAELIRDHQTPRRLTVVSSDHRVQRAARRRRATAVDSEVWYAQLLRQKRERQQPESQKPANSDSKPATETDAAWWQTQFDPQLLQELDKEISSQPEPVRAVKQKSDSRPSRSPDSSPPETATSKGPTPVNDSHPFPPGYLDQIQRELESNPPSFGPVKPRTKNPRRRKWR